MRVLLIFRKETNSEPKFIPRGGGELLFLEFYGLGSGGRALARRGRLSSNHRLGSNHRLCFGLFGDYRIFKHIQ